MLETVDQRGWFPWKVDSETGIRETVSGVVEKIGGWDEGRDDDGERSSMDHSMSCTVSCHSIHILNLYSTGTIP